jgi:hypothetical protein
MFISVVPYNRELLVINDMDVFTSFFCYAKKQKKGLVSLGKQATVTEGMVDGDTSRFGHIEDSEDADLRPITNIGFRY